MKIGHLHEKIWLQREQVSNQYLDSQSNFSRLMNVQSLPCGVRKENVVLKAFMDAAVMKDLRTPRLSIHDQHSSEKWPQL